MCHFAPQFMAGLSNMALWVQVPMQPPVQQPAASAASMDASLAGGAVAQANGATAGDSAAGARPPQQQQQQQAASWGHLWNQMQALAGFHPRLGILLQARCILFLFTIQIEISMHDT